MIEIQVIDEHDVNIFVYSAEVIPRVGEYLTVHHDTKFYLKVESVEHYIRPHGGTGSLISPCVRIIVKGDKID